MKKPLSLVLSCATIVSALCLTACGEKSEKVGAISRQPLTLMLDYFPNADHVGIYQGLAAGDFRNAGIDLHIQTPTDPATPLKLLAAGRVDVAISYEPEVLLARDKGEPLVSIAAVVQKPLTAIVSIGSKKITNVQALKGKRVGDSGIPYQHAYLQTILSNANLALDSVKETNVGFNLVPAMLSGQVDATLGAYWNYEAIQLAMKHKHPNVIHMEQVGVPTYDELVLVVTRKTLMTKADELRRFVQAMARGYEAARNDPAAAVQTLVHSTTGLEPKFQLASVKATLPVFFPADPSQPWGWQNQNEWNNYGAWMLQNHLVSNPAAVAQASTNELLAGQGTPGNQAGTGSS